MRKSLVRSALALSAVLMLGLQSCKDDSNLTTPLPTPDQSFVETFDNFQEAYNRGWRTVNRSEPVGRTWYDIAEVPNMGTPNYVSVYGSDWGQAQLTVDSNSYVNVPFPRRYWKGAWRSNRAVNGYAAASISSGEVLEDFFVNNWLVSPEVLVKNGDKISFHTFSLGKTRLQVWMNPSNTLNVGNAYDNTGDFNTKLVDINPNFHVATTNPITAYPRDWTRFEGVVGGLEKPTRVRFGFRFLTFDPALDFPTGSIQDYFNAIHRSVVGIDEVEFNSAK